jgi:hypothetical protein
MLDELTNDSKFLLTSMYKEYLQRRIDNVDHSKARRFKKEFDIHNEIMPEWSQSDVHDSISELAELNLLETSSGGDAFVSVTLSAKAIAQMEITFKDRISSVLDYVAKIKSIIPFV